MLNLKQLECDCIKIHDALHSNVSIVCLDTWQEPIAIKIAPNSCRYLSYKQTTFIQQDKAKKSRYAIAAQKGSKITWGMRKDGGWILITNGVVSIPSDMITIPTIIELINNQHFTDANTRI